MAITISQTSVSPFIYQSFGPEVSLIPNIPTSTLPNQLTTSSYIEFFIFDPNKNIVANNYNFTNYSIIDQGQYPDTDAVSSIYIDIEQQVINNELFGGEYITYFNFFDSKVGSQSSPLIITEISPDRTELRLTTSQGSNDQAIPFINERENSDYFIYFYLNFGNNQTIIGTNITIDNSIPNNPTLLVKLYQPLPIEFTQNSNPWIVVPFSGPIAYDVNIESDENVFILDNSIKLSGPNFNLDIKDQINNSTNNFSYSDLISTQLTSSLNQINSLLEEKEIDINIDYTDFSNFIHFSSAKTRLENFFYKVSLIENYSASIAILNNTTNSTTNVSSSKTIYENKINNIITNFDGYDYYLYYSSGSYTWPKTTNEPPYLLDTTTSITTLTWFGSDDVNSPYYGGIILSASIYDDENQNSLYYAIPEYLRDDPANDQYSLFVDMVGQHYDNIWIYYQDVTQKYNADNRLEYGISKDIVADAIRDFGIKLYQNNFSNEDLYTAFLGLTPNGALFPFPNITGSLPTPTGFEYIDTLISASNDYLPLDDVNKSLYKRIYHNLPYLLKTKGTLPGLRALITSYGIPDTILRISEFGGKDKVNYNDWDYWQNEFNYAFCTTGSNFISSSWELNPSWNAPDNVPSTLMFRFKPGELPQTNILPSQSIWYSTDNGTSGSALILTYTGSAYNSGSYSGSAIDPYYQYATLTFYPDTFNSSVNANVYLPFYNGGWWSVMVTRDSNNFGLYVQNMYYEGGDNGTKLGFNASSSITGNDTLWTNASTSYFPVSFSVSGSSGGYNVGFYDVALYDVAGGSSFNCSPFLGCYQEIRYYNTPIDESTFRDYTMNPYSAEGNSLNSSPNELVFRATVAGELYQENISIHPKITGSWPTTNSFLNGSTFYYDTTPEYFPNTEYFFSDQPIIGIKNRVSDKIRIENNTLYGDTLSPFRSLSQQIDISQSSTPNLNYLEVAFSPQNEINDDIISQIGYFNIGEFIGDPRFRSSSALSYPDLDKLRDEYFEKYTKNYDLNDFIRLIKFFDNSLFKMIKDFVPARTSLASGVVIKQHILERNRYPQPQMEWEDLDISGTLKPQWNDYQPGTVENLSGGTGGSFERFNYVSNTSQSWYETTNTPLGSVLVLHNNQDEFYDGEFSGSNILVSNGILNEAYPQSNQSFLYRPVYYYGGNFNESNIFENSFLNNNTSPQDGEILFDLIRSNSTTFFDTWGYIKIAKTDCSGSNNTNALGQIDTLLLETPLAGIGNKWIKYTITVLNEQPNYYLYKINNAKFTSTNTSASYFSTLYPNQVFDYTVSSSVTASYSVGNGSPKTIINWNSTLAGTNLPHYGTSYFNTSSGILTFENTPNTLLTLSASINTLGNDPTSRFIRLIQNRNGVETTLFQDTYNAGGADSTLVTSSFYPIQGDQYYIQLTKTSTGVNVNVTSAQLLLTQSRTISASNCESVIFEPYITTANFYNSDENALLNNAEDETPNTRYMEVSYNPGIITPTNFAQIISGSATKAKIPDSNYTSKRITIPRYDGSRSTSQKLNTWSPPNTVPGYSDQGTYGKIPTVESLKVMVAYGEMEGGWSPEKMNASAFSIKYLIDSIGNVIIPNVTENSLGITQGTFQTGEKFKISSKNPGYGDPQWQYRTVIRGGSTIQPILYTQSGSAPNAQWNTTMSFEDIVPSNTGATSDFSAFYKKSTSMVLTNNVETIIPLDTVIYGAPIVSGDSYQITSQAITDGINLTFKSFNTLYSSFGNASVGITATLNLYKNSISLSNKITLPNNSISWTYNPFNSPAFLPHFLDKEITIPTSDLVAGDKYFTTIEISYSSTTPGTVSLDFSNFKISQYPIYTSPVTSSGINSIWGYADATNYPYIITSSNQTLVELFRDPNTKMSNITGSGFNPITYPWSIEYGDEFRFEGREDFVYQVGKIFAPQDSGSGRITQTGSIEVHFNFDLPTSASSSVFNLDHFLIRRYTDEPSQIIFEGFKPQGSSGPYILTPEYSSPELNKSIDEYITDLTQKGLL